MEFVLPIDIRGHKDFRSKVLPGRDEANMNPSSFAADPREAGNAIETHEHAGDSKSGDALRSARLALIPCWRHTTFVRSGRSGRPRETKGVTVTVPLLTGREIRALKRPEASSV